MATGFSSLDRTLRVLPHAIDTLLLASALTFGGVERPVSFRRGMALRARCGRFAGHIGLWHRRLESRFYATNPAGISLIALAVSAYIVGSP